jgi:subtilisin family serine protease
MQRRTAFAIASLVLLSIFLLLFIPATISFIHRPSQRFLETAALLVPSLVDRLTARATKRWVVELREGQDPLVVAAKHDYRYVGPLEALPGMHEFEEHVGGRKRSDAPTLDEAMLKGELEWAEQQVERRRYTRTLTEKEPTDPLYSKQWHLKAASVPQAWTAGYSGQGILVSIVDDGLAHAHPDLRDRYVASASRDINGRASDPLPRNGDSHGTSCGGLAVGTRDNGECGVGAAFLASLAGVRLIGGPATDMDEAEGLLYGLTSTTKPVDIYSSSWGPTDDGRRLEGPQRLTLAALERGTREGRGGKGAIYVWACGNGRASQDRSDYDGYASSRYTVAVGALGKHGSYPYYSEPGSSVLVVAPSSDGIDAISTCRAPTGCTSSFGGTSAAAPLVAGILALVLEARPALGWRDVQLLLAHNSERVDFNNNNNNNEEWQLNGGGLWTSHQFGYGLVNASRLTQVALTWPLVGPVLKWESQLENTLKLRVPEESPVLKIEHVEIYVDLRTPNRGALTLTLSSPVGTKSTLMKPHADKSANVKWLFTSVRHVGEKSAGDWTLSVQSGTLEACAWQLRVYGT